jgi:hypothetical protein
MYKPCEADRRCISNYQEYPGATTWKEYEYLCPVCNTWGGGSDVTQTNEDGTESMLCEDCAEKAFPTTLPFPAKE